MQINRSTKKTLKSFFHVSSTVIEFFANSDLKTIIAADLNHPKTKRNVIAPVKNTINSKVIQYDLLYPS
jgi:hypothetical protein